MLIQIADSIAASLMPMTCAVRCTSNRSTTSIVTMAPTSASQTHAGVSKLAKFSLDLEAATVRAAGKAGKGGSGWFGNSQPKVSPAPLGDREHRAGAVMTAFTRRDTPLRP